VVKTIRTMHSRFFPEIMLTTCFICFPGASPRAVSSRFRNCGYIFWSPVAFGYQNWGLMLRLSPVHCVLFATRLPSRVISVRRPLAEFQEPWNRYPAKGCSADCTCSDHHKRRKGTKRVLAE